MAVVYWCVGILIVYVVVFFRSPGVFHSQDIFPSTFRLPLWETSSGVVAVGVFAAEALRARNPGKVLRQRRRLYLCGYELAGFSTYLVGSITVVKFHCTEIFQT